MVLFLISFFYAGANWFYHFLYDDLYLLYIYEVGWSNAVKYMDVLNELHKYSLAVIFTILAYTASKRSYKSLFSVLAPLSTYVVGYIWVESGYMNYTKVTADFVEYIGGIILVVILPVICLALKKCCSNAVIYASVTWICLLIYVFITLGTKNDWCDVNRIVTTVVDEYLVQISAGVVLTAGLLSCIDTWRKHDFIH